MKDREKKARGRWRAREGPAQEGGSGGKEGGVRNQKMGHSKRRGEVGSGEKQRKRRKEVG